MYSQSNTVQPSNTHTTDTEKITLHLYTVPPNQYDLRPEMTCLCGETIIEVDGVFNALRYLDPAYRWNTGTLDILPVVLSPKGVKGLVEATGDPYFSERYTEHKLHTRVFMSLKHVHFCPDCLSSNEFALLMLGSLD